MKKFLSLILSIILVFSCFGFVVSAESTRPVKTKFYLHYKNSSTGMRYDMLSLSSRGKLEAGDYVVSFNENSSNSNSYTTFFISGLEGRTAMSGKHNPHHAVNTAYFSGTTKLNNTATETDSREYRFTLTETQAAFNYQYFGFYFAKAAGVEFILTIADFTVYKADDVTKTNLLDTNDYKTNLKNWYGDSYSGTGLLNVARFIKIGYVPYTEETVNINLNNSLYKLSNATDSENPTFKVGFIGGSVTDGAGATDKNSTSWRAVTRDWIKESFPNAEVTEVEAAIGATGSFYGLYRAEKHLIKEKAPDLCFIEYAINDAPGYDAIYGNTIHNNYTNLESIIQKIYASNPYADIVMVVTGDRTWLESEATSEYPIFGTTHTELAEYYSLPIIYLGRELAKDIYVENGNAWPDSDTNEVWAKYYTDYVHPTDLGYKCYADTVINYLESQWLSETAVTTEYTDKTQSNLYPQKTFAEVNEMGDLYLDADIVYPNQLNPANLGGFNWSLSGDYYPLVSTAEGDSITLEFNSSNFGIWAQGEPVGTDFTYSIDGGEEITQNVKTKYISACYMLAEGLDNSKKHTITITHKDTNELNISYFLMSDMPQGESAVLTAVDPSGDSASDQSTQKTMLHIGYHNTGSGTAYDMVALGTKGKLDAGDYVVSFTKDSGYSNIKSFMILGMNSLSSIGNNYTLHHASSTNQFPNSSALTALSNTGTGNRVEYKFTLTEEQASFNYQRFGFYFIKASGVEFDMNIADFAVYKAGDASKTNLLNSSKYKTDLIGWASDYKKDAAVADISRFTEFEYVPYQPDLFKTVVKIDFIRNSTSTSNLEDMIAQRINGALIAGKEYTIEFNYYIDDESIGLPVVCLFGSNASGTKMESSKVLRANRYHSCTKFGGKGIYGNKVKFTFTLTDAEAIYSYYTVGFNTFTAPKADYSLYISDFTVYETADTYRNSLLYNDNFVNTVDNWNFTFYKFSGSASSTYNNVITLSSVPYGTGDANCDGEFDIRDLVRLKKQIVLSSASMNPFADLDDNGVLNSFDIVAVRKQLLVIW